MGCTNCRISQLDSQFFRVCRNPNVFVLDFEPLLTEPERNFWLKELAIKGIPEEDFWNEFNGFHHPCFAQIAKDINRTFPALPFFSNKAHVERFQLLLKKFAIYFPKIGYTQGLNFLAGFLLICGFDNNSAFKLLVEMMVHEKILAIGLYEDQFPLNKFYCQVFWNLLVLKLPKVAEKISKSKVQNEIWIFQWFISYFLYSFPKEYVKKFWDFIILKKDMSIVLVAVGIVRCLKNDILNMKNPDEFQFLQLFQNTKDYEFCRVKLGDLKKMTVFMNSITPQEIQKAICQTKCIDNGYRKYFVGSSLEKNQSYIKMIKYFKYERTCFKANPDPRKYSRNLNSTNHLQNLMLSKYKLYQSQFKRSNVASSIFKMSTFSIALEGQEDFGQKNKKSQVVKGSNQSIKQSFFHRIHFAQSKVYHSTSIEIPNAKNNTHKSHEPQKVSRFNKGSKPFQELSETQRQQNPSNQLGSPVYIKKSNSHKQNPDFTKKPKSFYVNP